MTMQRPHARQGKVDSGKTSEAVLAWTHFRLRPRSSTPASAATVQEQRVQ